MQDLLVGLGALLLAVAAVVFLAFSWDRLGISGRSAVVGALTVAVLAGAMLARRARMGATAEAVAAFGAVLVVLDAVAVRVSGLVGEPVGGLAYTAGAAVACAVVLAAVGSLGRLRAPVFAAALVAPIAPVAAGFSLAAEASTQSAVVVLGALGLLGGAAISTARPLLLRRGLVAESVMLEGLAYVLVTITVAGALVSAAAGLLGAGTFVLVAAAVLAAVMTLTAKGRDVWSVVVGASAAAGATLWAIDLGGWEALALAPATAGLVALAAMGGWRASGGLRTSGDVSGPALRLTARGALVVTGLAAVPGAVVAAAQLLPALAALARPWQEEPGARWSEAMDLGSLTGPLDEHRVAGLAAVVVVALVLAAWAWLGERPWSASCAAAALGALLVCAPWQPDLLLGVVALVAAASGGAAISIGHLLRHRAAPAWLNGRESGTVLVVAGSLALTLGVTTAWLAEELAVPATAVGTAALLMARWSVSMRWTGPGGAAPRAMLSLAVTLAALALVAAVGGVRGLSGVEVFVLAGLAAAIAPVVVSVPTGLAGSERRTVAGAGALAVVMAMLAARDAGTFEAFAPLRWEVLLVALTLAAATVAVDPRQVWSSIDRRVAAPVTVVLATWSASALTVLAGAGGTVLPGLASAGVLALACLVAAELHRREHPLTVGVEVASVVVAILVLGQAAESRSLGIPVWPVLLTLAAGALVLASVPSRRWVGWVALVLGTAAWWERLAAEDVGLVEVWTFPPALVLAALAAHAIYRRRDPLRPTAIGAALLLVLPSTAAAVSGVAWRPAALVAAAGLAVGLTMLVPRRDGDAGRRDRRLVLLLVAAALVAVTGVWARALLAPSEQVELWALAAAAVLAAAAGVAVSRGTDASPWRGWLPASVLPAAGLPSMLAPGAFSSGVDSALSLGRHLAVLLVTGAVLVLCAERDRLPWGRPTRWVALALLAVAGTSGVLRPLPGTFEVVTITAGVVLVVAGWVELRRRPEVGSWPLLGSGLVVALAPSLLLALTEDVPLRGVLLVVAAGAVLGWGAAKGSQAPVVVSTAVLVVYAMSQLVVVYEAVPRWASLAVVGTALIALGARYERRLRDLGILGRRLAAMR